MTIIRRNLNSPFLPDWLEDFFSTEVNPLTKSRVASVPMVNVFENEESYRIELAAPGLKKEDFAIELDKDVLTISSEQENSVEDSKENCTKREYSYSSFSRSFTLPESADKEKISAKAEEGILKISIMKREEEKIKPARQISIE